MLMPNQKMTVHDKNMEMMGKQNQMSLPTRDGSNDEDSCLGMKIAEDKLEEEEYYREMQKQEDDAINEELIEDQKQLREHLVHQIQEAEDHLNMLQEKLFKVDKIPLPGKCHSCRIFPGTLPSPKQLVGPPNTNVGKQKEAL